MKNPAFRSVVVLTELRTLALRLVFATTLGLTLVWEKPWGNSRGSLLGVAHWSRNRPLESLRLIQRTPLRQVTLLVTRIVNTDPLIPSEVKTMAPLHRVTRLRKQAPGLGTPRDLLT